MENIKELFAEWGLWSLVEDISDDGDGTGDNLQLTKEGSEAQRMIEQQLDKAREEGRDKWLRFYRKDILNGFLPKCSCGKRATIQTARGKYAQENLQRPCNWGWYCKKCFKEGLELEREAMGYYDIPVTN